MRSVNRRANATLKVSACGGLTATTTMKDGWIVSKGWRGNRNGAAAVKSVSVCDSPMQPRKPAVRDSVSSPPH